ncbi:MAG: lipid-A-disaccharide synthase [Deltaproteobacteria bacterium]|nr:lipid-A-disaccharide synthase [Deltaproteobacteria bacterium]
MDAHKIKTKDSIEPNERVGHAPKILIVAGEASGDLHGANLLKALHAIDPAIRFYGVGGKKMTEAGMERIADSADMAVVGFTEVISKLRYIMDIRAQLKSFIKKEKPDLLVTIDYPDFNIPLAKAAKKLGVKVFYYISPQVWAWRRGRVKTIARIVDAMGVILPFEEQIYQAANMNVQFVGHPLLDAVQTNYSQKEAQEKFNLEKNRITIGLLPGSRKSEVAVLLPEMLKASQILKERLQNSQFIMPLADSLPETWVEKILGLYNGDVTLIKNNIYDVINVSDLVIVASGTATLETALLEKPMIIVYKVSRLSYYIGRTFIKIANIGLVNIIAGKTVVPELIQDRANGRQIAAEATDILTRADRMADIKSALKEIKSKLGTPGASTRAARLAYDVMKGRETE